jgi:predicted ATPase
VLERNLRQIWDQLRAKKPQLARFLDEVRIQGLRGIRDLRVPFTYPVSVVAGHNASGKSTVLFAAACAYSVPQAGAKDFVPSTLFPDLRSSDASVPKDALSDVRLSFSYLHDGDRLTMQWARRKGWNRSFGGLKGGYQPSRLVYLRTLRSLSNPSEVRSVLQISRRLGRQVDIDADLLRFAHQILPFQYQQVIELQAGRKDLLFADRGDQGRYSEFHMSAGERAVLRLSRDISRLSGALVLIDEIEAGLHPHIQQQLMLQLQRLALRNDLQIVVTTHSPAVLDAVPSEAKLFLERTPDGSVQLLPPYRDVLERAFYGRTFDRLTVLCEDEIAEAIVRGVCDVLKPLLGLVDEDLAIGRDTGKDEFPAYVRALVGIDRLASCLFVLDGDARDAQSKILEAAQKKGAAANLLFLPGNRPETLVFESLQARAAEYATHLGITEAILANQLATLDKVIGGAADTERNKAKSRLEGIASFTARSEAQLARLVARHELEVGNPPLRAFAEELQRQIEAWRSLRSQ